MGARKLHDCGSHGMLTVRQIARAAGVKLSAAQQRATSRDRVQEDIVRPVSAGPRQKRTGYNVNLHASFSANKGMFIACSIAKLFGDRKPTRDLLMDHFGMSRATAYRWIAAWRDAHGVAG